MALSARLSTVQRPTPSVGPVLRQAIGFLEMSNAEIARALKRELVDLPTVSVTTDVSTGTAPSLSEHAAREADLLFDTADDRRIADHFVAALDHSGWLDRPLERIAADAGVSCENAKRILTRLQQAEPTGIFATNLADCLRLQAEDQDLLTPALAAVLDNLGAFEGGLGALAAATGLSEAETTAALGLLRGFNPKPGAAFGAPDPALARPHDLDVTIDDRTVDVAFNPATLPRLDIDAAAPSRVRRLADMIERRNEMTLAIARVAVHHQHEWLSGATEVRRKLRRVDVAEAAGVHESTVSRIAGALTLSAPRGTVPLRDLFSLTSHLDTAIAEAIRREDPSAPLSDACLVRELRARGVSTSRRSIARRRAELGLPSALERRP